MTQEISKIEEKELLPGIKGRFIHTQNNSIGFITLDKGAVLPEHAHMHEQTTQVIQGKLELIIDGKVNVLESGMIINIPPNVPHKATAITDCKVTDIFSPVREDYK